MIARQQQPGPRASAGSRPSYIIGRKMALKLWRQMRNVLDQMPHFNLVIVMSGAQVRRFVRCTGSVTVKVSGSLGPDLKLGDFKGVMRPVH